MEVKLHEVYYQHVIEDGNEWSRHVKVKVKQSRYRPGQAQRVPGS
jgi:hypothetical protein